MAKTAQVKNNKNQKFHLSKNVSLAFEFIGIGVVIIAIVLVITGGGGFDFNLGFDSKDKNSGLNMDEIVSKAKSGMSYEDAKTTYPTSIFNPNITNADQNTFSDNKNVLIVFNGNNIDLTEINIKQGDIVTWQNKSNKAVKVIGDNWGSTNVLRNNTSFSQQFDFLGEYEYEVVEEDDNESFPTGIEGVGMGESNRASGVIVVIK